MKSIVGSNDGESATGQEDPYNVLQQRGVKKGGVTSLNKNSNSHVVLPGLGAKSSLASLSPA